jgi:hypothetical protein
MMSVVSPREQTELLRQQRRWERWKAITAFIVAAARLIGIVLAVASLRDLRTIVQPQPM